MSQKQLEKLAQKLFAQSDLRKSFVAALTSPERMAQALIWRKQRPPQMPFDLLPAHEWQMDFVDRVSTSSAAGKNELHEQGAFYCLDFASTVAAPVLAGSGSKGSAGLRSQPLAWHPWERRILPPEASWQQTV